MKLRFTGFMVMKELQLGLSFIITPSNKKTSKPSFFARKIVRICCAITDKTSKSILLNSSKQAQAPVPANPLTN
eukprot:snap_masked-scaffold_6-processed-gene-16.40-mRNA-1 protein AED:1.00 eAED:1.00 QI:0/-1/0/0/-1/1/1/0/73